MTRYCILPYSAFELEAIERWLNQQAEAGWALQSLGAWAKFRRTDGPRQYYRVRYIPENRDIQGTIWWGDLYVYTAASPADLPVRPPEDQIAAAKRSSNPAAAGTCAASAMILLQRIFRSVTSPAGWSIWVVPELALLVTLSFCTIYGQAKFGSRAKIYARGEQPEPTVPPRNWTLYALWIFLFCALVVLAAEFFPASPR